MAYRTRIRSKDYAVTGGLHLKLIPPKTSSISIHDPMVTLTFHITGGDELIIYCNESKHAPAIFEHLKQSLTPIPRSHEGHFIRNLSIPNFDTTEEA